MGGGKVGAFLAEALDGKGHQVAVIERSQERRGYGRRR
jgi:2-polyprenyl-6-methoxyphenol hydroxylase-like FAD-dependent oxidoreductase